MDSGSLDSKHTRAELRRYSGAYFRMSGYCASVAVCLQVAAVFLASSSFLRDILQPTTKWILLGVATGPFFRWLAEQDKRTADAILRRIEVSDGLGAPIPPRELEEVREDASSIIDLVVRGQPLDLAPYASDQPTGPTRIVENTRETAWWSTRLANDLKKWEYFWTAVLFVACIAALFQIATDHAVGQPGDTSRAVAEFAATLVVVVFAEGAYRRGREFADFAEESKRIVDRSEQILKNRKQQSKEAATVEALLLSFDYARARNNAPRLSTFWYNRRRKRLNAAWDRANRKIDP
jgi:hypothetical protein